MKNKVGHVGIEYEKILSLCCQLIEIVMSVEGNYHATPLIFANRNSLQLPSSQG